MSTKQVRADAVQPTHSGEKASGPASARHQLKALPPLTFFTPEEHNYTDDRTNRHVPDYDDNGRDRARW